MRNEEGIEKSLETFYVPYDELWDATKGTIAERGVRTVIAAFVVADWLVSVIACAFFAVPVSVIVYGDIDMFAALIFGLAHGGVLTILYGTMPMDKDLFAKMTDGKTYEVKPPEKLRWLKKMLWLTFSVAYTIVFVWWIRNR